MTLSCRHGKKISSKCSKYAEDGLAWTLSRAFVQNISKSNWYDNAGLPYLAREVFSQKFLSVSRPATRRRCEVEWVYILPSSRNRAFFQKKYWWERGSQSKVQLKINVWTHPLCKICKIHIKRNFVLWEQLEHVWQCYSVLSKVW